MAPEPRRCCRVAQSSAYTWYCSRSRPRHPVPVARVVKAPWTSPAQASVLAVIPDCSFTGQNKKSGEIGSCWCWRNQAHSNVTMRICALSSWSWPMHVRHAQIYNCNSHRSCRRDSLAIERYSFGAARNLLRDLHVGSAYCSEPVPSRYAFRASM